jgi:hypothetical protein
MPRYIVFEFSDIQEKLQESYVIIGDLIEYCPNNQEGWILYTVVDKDGKKVLERLSDYYTHLD